MKVAQSNRYTNSVAGLTIKGISEPVVLRYFETLNAGDFATTASLFALEGALHPPFEEPVVGREAIAAYLKAEAEGMTLYPSQGIVETLEDNQIRVEIQGKVKTLVFGVNVAWQFILTPDREILHVQVKLLASLQELLKLRR
ncbi:MAG: ketosteroid isomerase family protein [Prochloraceae cyanobacterium]